MLVLRFYLGDIMYVMRSDRVKEVAPMVNLKKIPHAPDSLAGLFNYRGRIVPVIDLCQLIHGYPCRMRLSTRIILIDFPNPPVLGIMAERVTEAINKSEEAILSPGIVMHNAPYLGGIVMEQKDMVHYIDLDRLASNLNFLPMLQNTTTHGAEID